MCISVMRVTKTTEPQVINTTKNAPETGADLEKKIGGGN